MPGGKRVDALLKINTRNMGWHGNAILVKQHVGVIDCAAIELPTFEPRGAVMAELLIGDRAIRVVGMHLDLSGLWRRRQIRSILEAVAGRPQRMPTILMGDTNEWRDVAGCLSDWSPISTSPRPGRASIRAIPSRRSTGSSSTRS